MLRNGVVDHSHAITRRNRSAYLLMLDIRSLVDGEMVEYRGEIRHSIEVAGDIVNRALKELYFRSQRNGELVDYYDVALICYFDNSVVSVFGDLENPFVTMAQLDRISPNHNWFSMIYDDEFECKGVIDVAINSHRYLVGEYGDGAMVEALKVVDRVVAEWCDSRGSQQYVAPTVINIADCNALSYCNLDDVSRVCDRIKQHALLINISLAMEFYNGVVMFPTDDEIAKLPDSYIAAYASNASLMPRRYIGLIHSMRKRNFSERYRAMGYGLSVDQLIAMMNIGTLSARRE